MISTFEMVARLFFAMLLGGLIGYQRGIHHHPAGLRTHIVVTLAATLFTMVSTQLLYFEDIVLLKPGQVMSFDPSRIASYVVAGMGFLGAGTIRHSRRRTHGLTTSATLWLVTAVGLALGAGMYVVATVTALAALFVLESLRLFEKYLIKSVADRSVQLTCVGSARFDTLLGQVRSGRWRVTGCGYGRDLDRDTLTLRFKIRLDDDELPQAIAMLESLDGVRRVEVGRVERSD